MTEVTNTGEGSPIAVVGMACEYPGASSPLELWENLLAQRRSFRRIPSERLRTEDYYSADRNAQIAYVMEAALIGDMSSISCFRLPGARIARST
jgi:acyl transferase domain-containing protein